MLVKTCGLRSGSGQLHPLLLLLIALSGLMPWWPSGSVRVAFAAGRQGIEFGAVIDDQCNRLLTAEVLDQVVATGAGWIKINFRLGGFSNWTEETRLCPDETGNFIATSALDLYDRIVEDALAKQLKVYGLLSNEARHGWLSVWQENNSEKTGGDGCNPYLGQFAMEAAGPITAHFAGRISLWEVWNEPNMTDTYLYPSNFACLLTLVRAETTTAQAAGAKFVLGAIASNQDKGRVTVETSGANYLKAVYQQGRDRTGWSAGAYPFDHVAQHLYIDRKTTTKASNLRTALKYVRDTYVAEEGTGTPKQTIISVVGWETDGDGVSESTQANNLKTMYTEVRNTSYVMNAYWFFLRDESWSGLSFGLLRADNSQKPAWNAYRQYAQ